MALKTADDRVQGTNGLNTSYDRLQVIKTDVKMSDDPI